MLAIMIKVLYPTLFWALVKVKTNEFSQYYVALQVEVSQSEAYVKAKF